MDWVANRAKWRTSNQCPLLSSSTEMSTPLSNDDPTMTCNSLWTHTVSHRITDRTRHKSQQYSRVVGAVDTVYWWPTMTVLCWSSVRHESPIRQTPSTAHHNSQLNIQSIVWDCSGVELLRGGQLFGSLTWSLWSVMKWKSECLQSLSPNINLL